MPLEGQSHKCNLALKCKAWKPADSMIISSIGAKEYGWVEEPSIPTQPLLVLNWAPMLQGLHKPVEVWNNRI
jgi:hypothetical protein